MAKVEARIEELMRPYVSAATTIGIMRVGSSVRPWADAASDLDLMIVVEDEAYAKMSARQHHVIGIDRGPPRRKEYDLIVHSWQQMLGYIDSPHDVHHYQYQFAQVLFDPRGQLTKLLPSLYALPEAVIVARRRVHYHEAFWLKLKTERCELRGNQANARFCAFLSVLALSRMLFVLHGSWAAFPDWTTQELRHVGTPEPIIALFEQALLAPVSASLEALFAGVDAWLDDQGHDFHQSPFELGDWCVYDDEGIASNKRWGLICG